jgi:hypothetical protein
VSAEAVGRPVDTDDRGSVQQSVEHGRGDGGVAERAGPVMWGWLMFNLTG